MKSLHDLFIGTNSPEIVNSVVEISQGSKVKYRFSPELEALKVDRVLSTSMQYPTNCGFIPQTSWDHGYPLDALILSQNKFRELALLEIKPIGVIRMSDEDIQNHKIIAVHAGDPVFMQYDAIEELPFHLIMEIKHFYENYKGLENRVVKVNGTGDKLSAHKMIERGVELYRIKKNEAYIKS